MLLFGTLFGPPRTSTCLWIRELLEHRRARPAIHPRARLLANPQSPTAFTHLQHHPLVRHVLSLFFSQSHRPGLKPPETIPAAQKRHRRSCHPPSPIPLADPVSCLQPRSRVQLFFRDHSSMRRSGAAAHTRHLRPTPEYISKPAPIARFHSFMLVKVTRLYRPAPPLSQFPRRLLSY